MDGGSLNTSINEPLRGLAFADRVHHLAAEEFESRNCKLCRALAGQATAFGTVESVFATEVLVEMFESGGVGLGFRRRCCAALARRVGALGGFVNQNGPALASDA